MHKEHVEFYYKKLRKIKRSVITIEDLLYLLKDKYPNLDLNKSHIGRIIHDNHITLKMTRIKHNQ